MSLKLVDFVDGRAVLESDLGGPGGWGAAIEELQSTTAKQFAIKEATKQGIPGAAIGMSGGTYPVDKSGSPVMPGPNGGTIAGYRIDIPVNSTFR